MKDTQKELILKHMQNNGGISTFDAFTLYHVTRLASRIHEIKSDGVPIKKERVIKKYPDRVVSYDVYMIGGEDGRTADVHKKDN